MNNATISNPELKNEVDEVLDFVGTLNQEERGKFIVFLQGARLARELGNSSLKEKQE